MDAKVNGNELMKLPKPWIQRRGSDKSHERGDWLWFSCIRAGWTLAGW